MKLRDEKTWNEFVSKNIDPYGACCVRYAQAWAELMETLMANGATVEQCAKNASHDADTEGITGFMYGCAVSMLALCWEHGEVLRRWHNLDTQLGTEGIEANESGGVLNPAVINIG
jgi:hypothetical protein